MTFDDALGDEQAEPDAPAIVFRQLDEAVKHRLQLIVGNAFPCVADAVDNVAINVVEPDDDRALSRRELQRVAQKIAEHLKNSRSIERNRGDAWHDVGPQ